MLDGLLGTVIAIVAGSLVAFGVAVGLSPLSPLGPVRRVYDPSVLALDWTVLGVGLALLVGGLGAAATILAFRAAPHRSSRSSRFEPSSSSRLVGSAAALGLPLPGVVGLHLALEPGRGRTAVPSAMGIGRRGHSRRYRDRYPHLQRQPEHVDLPAPALWVGLGLRPYVGKWGPAPGPHPP